jgi:hypothetical protein
LAPRLSKGGALLCFALLSSTEAAWMIRYLLICAVLVSLGALTLAGTWFHLRSRQQEYEDRLAQEREQAEYKESAAVLEKAILALRRRNVAEGTDLLATYLDHERAAEKERARQLLADVRRATATQRAAVALRKLSDAQLDKVEAGDPVATEDQVSDELIKPIFLDTLRAQLPKERQRRSAQIAERKAKVLRLLREKEAREARVRESAPYKQMVALAQSLRKRYLAGQAMRDKQKRALERLTRELNIDAEDQAKLRKEAEEGDTNAAAHKKTFAERRAAARKAFQALAGVTAADLEVFDQFLKRLADNLLVG